MNFALSDEQGMLREAARDAVARLDTVASARAALDGGTALDLWPTARQAGWTGLLIDEDRGGAGLGVFDAMLVHEELGRGLTGAGVLGHLLAASVLRDAADHPELDGLLPQLASGERRAVLAPARPPVEGGEWTVETPGGESRRGRPPSWDGEALDGEIGFVPDLAGADLLVVAALDSDDQPLSVLVDPGATGVEIEPVMRYDATRPLGHLRLERAVGVPLPVNRDALGRAWFTAQALLAAEAVGASQAMLDLALEYAKDRHTFGRPIGSYQAIKHQLVDILRRIGTTTSLLYYAGYAADDAGAADDFPLAASCARFAAEECADFATRTCIAIHGGIGATWEHDAPLYWRRSQLSRLLLGGRLDAGDRVAEEIIRKARAVEAAATTP